MSYLEKALRLRPYIEEAAQSLPSEKAVKAKALYPKWDDLVKLGRVEADANSYKFRHGSELYICINANPTFQENWVPGVGTESMYTKIDETHEGTLEDPIPYSGNMALVNGLYYTQDGVIYLCTQRHGQPRV